MLAIYSCRMESIGRTTHAPGTAGAHIRYISRDGAAPEILARHMPDHPHAARAWIEAAENADRKNARVADKILVALPRELTNEQRAALVQGFMHGLTDDRVPWFAAIHQQGKDAHNPHAHIVVRDRDIDTGKRFLCLSDKPREWQAKGRAFDKPILWVRDRWEHYANDALARAGHEARIDRRSYQERGIARTPQIHEGAKARAMRERGYEPQSKSVARRSWNGKRTVDYPKIDRGRTRAQRNHQIAWKNRVRTQSGDHVARAVELHIHRRQLHQTWQNTRKAGKALREAGQVARRAEWIARRASQIRQLHEEKLRDLTQVSMRLNGRSEALDAAMLYRCAKLAQARNRAGLRNAEARRARALARRAAVQYRNLRSRADEQVRQQVERQHEKALCRVRGHEIASSRLPDREKQDLTAAWRWARSREHERDQEREHGR